MLYAVLCCAVLSCRHLISGRSQAWPSVFLPRRSGYGVSGGWRGFAIDMHLHPNDAGEADMQAGLRLVEQELVGGTASIAVKGWQWLATLMMPAYVLSRAVHADCVPLLDVSCRALAMITSHLQCMSPLV